MLFNVDSLKTEKAVLITAVESISLLLCSRSTNEFVSVENLQPGYHLRSCNLLKFQRTVKSKKFVKTLFFKIKKRCFIFCLKY